MEGTRYRAALVASALFLVLAAFGAGWVVNWGLQAANISLPLPAIPLPNGQRLQPIPAAAAAEVDEQDLSVFWQAMALLDQNYYAQDTLPRDGDLTYSAIEGVIDATGDPHSSFMDPELASEFAMDLEGEFQGIGARVDMGEEGLVIVAPFPGSPADQAGLEPGDVVLEIDGQATQGMDLLEAVSLVRGDEGTVVRLTILRPGETEVREIEVTRDNIVIPVVETRLIEVAEGAPIGYIRLNEFNRNATEQFKEGLRELQAQGAERLILDLRNNPGGLLTTAVDITSQFIDEGLVLTERTASDREIRHAAKSGGLALDVPLVVLINEGSASASEILAGALKDTGRATLIGTTTFGKGSVQRLHTLSDESLLRITVARWFTPDGNAIHEVGIEPDVYVEPVPDDAAPDADPQLDAAVDFFTGATANAPNE